MEKSGIPVSRWFDAVIEETANRPAVERARHFYWGHAPNSQTRGLEMKPAMDKLDLLVVIDPFVATPPWRRCERSGRQVHTQPGPRGVLLPAATQFETEGSCTASNRSLQWRERVIEPLFDSRSDQAIMYAFAQKWGFADQLLAGRRPAEHPPRQSEELRGAGSRGRAEERDQPRRVDDRLYRPDPERLQAHMRNMQPLRRQTLRAPGGRDAKTGYDLTGDYSAVPWPCYGTP